jgi:hypothetical protein
MSEELQDIAPLPIEERISNELVKHNVTEAIIAKIREDYLPLKIAGIEDKETYLIVKDARKHCKELRVLAKKICVDGREDAVAIQKAWVAKEKDVTGRIGEVEDYLEKQEKEYEAAVAKEKEDRKRRQEEQLIMRQQVLTGMGALYSDGSFHLGEVSFELSVVKESEPDIWEESILPKFKEEYEKVEAERIEQERIKREQEAEMKRQQDELERKQRELAEKEAALKAAQEEQERKQKEEEAKKAAEVNAAREAKYKTRCDQLTTIGLFVGMEGGHLYFKGYDCWVSHLDIIGHDDEKWSAMIEDMKVHVAKKKEEAEQKRLAEIEAQKELEKKRILGESRLRAFKELGSMPIGVTSASLSEISEDEYDTLYRETKDEYEAAKKIQWEREQEEKRQLEEVKRQQELEISGDKVKWAEVMKQFESITLYTMISSQYKKKMAILREKLEEIKSL